MAGTSIFDKAIDAISNRDELQALDTAKKVAQEALIRAQTAETYRDNAIKRATEAEAKVAELMGQSAGARSMEVMNMANEMTMLRTHLAQAQAEAARTKAEKNELDADLHKQIDALKAAAVTAMTAPGAASATYTVKGGDSLSKISKAVYGDWKHWKEIFEANKDQISNPDLIRVGQVIKIPKL